MLLFHYNFSKYATNIFFLQFLKELNLALFHNFIYLYILFTYLLLVLTNKTHDGFQKSETALKIWNSKYNCKQIYDTDHVNLCSDVLASVEAQD